MDSIGEREPSTNIGSCQLVRPLLVLVAIGLVLVMTTASPTSAEEVEFSSGKGYGGLTFDVAVKGEHGYAVMSSGVLVLNLSGPTPQEVTFLSLKGISSSIATHEQSAYIGNSLGLVILDLSFPDEPKVKFRTSYMLEAEGAAFSTKYGYFVTQEGGLTVLDLQGSGFPSVLTEVHDFQIRSLALSGDLLYVLEKGWGVRTYQLNWPDEPLAISNHSLEGNLRSMTLAEGWLYVAAEGKGVHLLDLSDPRSPSLESNLETPSAREVAVLDGLALVADEERLQVFDVADPSSPSKLGTFSEKDMLLTDLAFLPGMGLMVEPLLGLRYFDISQPINPTEVGKYRSLVDPQHMYSEDDLLYVVDQQAGLVILDLSEISNIQEIGRYRSQNPLQRFIKTGGLGLALESRTNNASAKGAGDLRILDMSDPIHPVSLGSFETLAHDLLWYEGMIYLADREGLRTVNLTHPDAPFQEAFTATPDYAMSLVRVMEHLFVSDLSGRLHVFSVEQPDNPELLVSLDLGCAAQDMAYFQGHLYLAEQGQGLCILQVSNPTQPLPVYDLQLPSAERVEVEDGRALVGAAGYGLWLINVSIPTEPSLMGFNGTPGLSRASQFHHGSILYLDNAVGLGVQKLNSRPYAKILAPNKDQFHQGQWITFTGEGHDPDGLVTTYRWSSNRQSFLHEGDTFTTDELEPGEHIISFSVLDDEGLASRFEQIRLNILWKMEVLNGTVSPGKGHANSTVFEFQVDYQGPPNILEPAVWLEVKGQGSYIMTREADNLTFNYRLVLPPGAWQYSFHAEFGSLRSGTLEGVPSSIMVNDRPLASIDVPIPGVHYVGHSHLLKGKGTDHDGTITAYVWRISYAETLSHEPDLDLAILPVGEYSLSFYVQDDQGRWSEPAVVKGVKVVKAPEAVEPLIPRPVKVGGGVVTVTIVASVAYGWIVIGESFRYRWWFLLAPLMVASKEERYSDDPLANEIRGLIRGYLLAHPGVHYGFLKEELGLVNGTLAYHLRVLEREGLVESEKVGRKRLFYAIGKGVKRPDKPEKPPTRAQRYMPWTGNGWGKQASDKPKDQSTSARARIQVTGRRAINARPVTKDLLLKLIDEEPGLNQSELAQAFGVSNAAIKYHLDQYITEGLVRKERNGMKVTYFPVKLEDT